MRQGKAIAKIHQKSWINHLRLRFAMYGVCAEPTTSEIVALDQVQKSLQKEGLTLKRGTDLDRFTSIFSKAKKALGDNSKRTSEEEDSLAMEFLKNLSEKQREKLLKKLSKLSEKSPKKKDHKSKHKHSKRH
ncbi:unnamed protein product [Heterobilharzia americana]|nr:unnamed protein product [Heterobilharzia americana]